jgi:hypothetical protein
MFRTATSLRKYKSFFRARFLLKVIAFLLVVLGWQHYSETNSIDSIGGPYEIARPAGYHSLLLLRFLIAGFLVPSTIGLLVYGLLRWRHSADQAPALGLSLLLPILVTWAWGLLGVLPLVAYPTLLGRYKSYYVVAMTLSQLPLAVIAARVGYYERLPIKQLVNE